MRESTGEEELERVPLEGVREELHRLMQSATFADSSRLRDLLSFLVEQTICGHAEELKESVVAVEVFGREPGFDPRSDSVVRVQARNLRAKLHSYYEDEGRLDLVCIELPSGGYVPRFKRSNDGPNPGIVAKTWAWRYVSWWAGAVLLAAALGVWWFAFRDGSPAGKSVRSIAVLPFLNLAGSTNADYATDGFVEDLTTHLAEVPALRVTSRTSAFQFRGKNVDAREIGHRLGVRAVLEGSVRLEPDRLKVTAQLIDTSSGYHLWSKSYVRDSASVDEVEGEIESAVVGALGAGPAASHATHLPSSQAKEAYWRGRYEVRIFQHHGEALVYYERAVALDPQYGEAWGALGFLHATMAFHLEGEVSEHVAKARAASKRALQLDPSNPQAYLAFATLSYAYDHRWKEAEESYRRALELSPSYAGGHRGYALALSAHGRFDEAITHLKLSEQLDPVSIVSSNDFAAALYCARRCSEAIETGRAHLEMDPDFFPARLVVGGCYLASGKFTDAIAEYEKARRKGGDSDMILGPLGNALARAGRVAEARSMLAKIDPASRPDKTGGVAQAMVLTGLGEKQQAIEALKGADRAHVTDVIFIGVEPIFDPLRREPEFQALCARLGLPGSGQAAVSVPE